MRLVGNGNAEFGFGDLPTLAIARSQDVPVVALAAVNQHSPLGMLALSSKHKLTKPEDLKGLNIGVQPSGSTYVFLKAFLTVNKMTMDDIKQSTVTPPYENYLLLGRIDAVPGYVDAEVPELEAKAGGPGSLSIMQGSNFGYTVYGSGLFTSEKMIAEKSDVVQRFVNVYLQAFADVIESPEEAADIVVEANPEYASKKDVLVKQIEADIKATFFSADTATVRITFNSVWAALCSAVRSWQVCPPIPTYSTARNAMRFSATPSTISETTVAASPGNPIAWQICRSASLRSSSIIMPLPPPTAC